MKLNVKPPNQNPIASKMRTIFKGN